MPTYALVGGLGSGKSLISTGKMMDYLRQGRPVATNFDLTTENLFTTQFKRSHYRLPDFPQLLDLQAIGSGNDSFDEKKNGLIVLDECGVFFNARDWADKSRTAVISWLRHSRKHGWDVFFLVQDVESIDKQIRKGLIEHEAVCKRADRFRIPFIGGLLQFLGLEKLAHPPRVHVATVKYGLSLHAPVVDRWIYRGSTIQNGYNTKQIFTEERATETIAPWFNDFLNSSDISAPFCYIEEPLTGRPSGTFSLLSPQQRIGRYYAASKLREAFDMFMTKFYKTGIKIAHKPKTPLTRYLEANLKPDDRIAFLNRFPQDSRFNIALD